MTSRRSWVDFVGPVLGVAAMAMVAFSLVYLLGIRPFYRGASYRAVPGAVSAAGWVREEASRRFDGPFERLEIKNVSGPVRIEGWSESSIEVSYVKEARSAQALEEFEIRMQPQGTTLAVQPIYGRLSGTQFGPVAFEIRVPPSVREIKAGSVSGHIVVENLPADVDQELESVSGRIETGRTRGLKARSVSGPVRFTSTGGTIEVNTTSGRVSGRILSLERGDSVEVGSISGTVELEAFAGLDAAVTLQSVSGSIACDFPLQLTEQRRNRLEGVIGGGSVPLTVKTVSGRIRLERAD